eukprot:1958024-Rhodomonas_salina.6
MDNRPNGAGQSTCRSASTAAHSAPTFGGSVAIYGGSAAKNRSSAAMHRGRAATHYSWQNACVSVWHGACALRTVRARRGVCAEESER